MNNTAGRTRLLIGLIAANLLLTGVVGGWAIWAVNDPEYWFPDAFAAKGPTGEQGARGERGRRGPVGPVGEPGPGVEDAQSTADEAVAGVDDVRTYVEDVDSRVVELENFDPYELDSRVSEVESDVQDLCDTLDSELDLYTC
jgi:hypothetical protein